MIVGICGFAGSGKDTVASFFMQKGFEKMSMADPLKDVTAAIFGLDRAMLQGDTPQSREWREKGDHMLSIFLGGKGVWQRDSLITPRLLLQRMGTDVMRNICGQDIWCDIMRKRAHGRNVVIPDIRFQNEADICDYIICIKRGESPDLDDIHESEKAHLCIKFDAIIFNNSTVEYLKNVVDSIITQIQ